MPINCSEAVEASKSALLESCGRFYIEEYVVRSTAEDRYAMKVITRLKIEIQRVNTNGTEALSKNDWSVLIIPSIAWVRVLAELLKPYS